MKIVDWKHFQTKKKWRKKNELNQFLFVFMCVEEKIKIWMFFCCRARKCHRYQIRIRIRCHIHINQIQIWIHIQHNQIQTRIHIPDNRCQCHRRHHLVVVVFSHHRIQLQCQVDIRRALQQFILHKCPIHTIRIHNFYLHNNKVIRDTVINKCPHHHQVHPIPLLIWLAVLPKCKVISKMSDDQRFVLSNKKYIHISGIENDLHMRMDINIWCMVYVLWDQRSFISNSNNEHFAKMTKEKSNALYAYNNNVMKSLK